MSGDQQRLFSTADVICFDFDSTLVKDESLMELAVACGVEQEIINLTNSAMRGAMTFQESLTARLNIIKPNKARVADIAQSVTFPLSVDAGELVKLLQEKKKHIYVISGGFVDLIYPITDQLDIPRDHVFANEFIYNEGGEYKCFKDLPTARSFGKIDVIEQIKKQHPGSSIVHIGDGATDLETRPNVNLFIGYGGNIVRKIVKEEAEYFINSFDVLINAISSQ